MEPKGRPLAIIILLLIGHNCKRLIDIVESRVITTFRLVGKIVFLDYAALRLGIGIVLGLGVVILVDFENILVILRGKDL